VSAAGRHGGKQYRTPLKNDLAEILKKNLEQQSRLHFINLPNQCQIPLYGSGITL